MKNSPYFKQAQLMLRVIPHVAAETCFGLKGGTALNLFLRDMPRLMVTSPVAYDALVETREKMLGILQQTLTEKEKRFLLSLKTGQPEWALMAIDGIEKLPAIQWKWINIQRMSTSKRAEALEKLQTVLGI